MTGHSTLPPPVEHVVSEPLLDEKAALQAADRLDLPMPDYAVDEITLTHDAQSAPALPQPTSTPDSKQQKQLQQQQLQQQQQQQQQQQSYYADSTPAPPPRRMSTYAKNQTMSLQRRLALANLPPITPVTTRSKERAAESAAIEMAQTPTPSSSSSSSAEQAAAQDQGIPKVDIDLDTNTDYIALSSTLELLHSQRETATEDIQTLRRLKETALDDPEAFIEKLKESGKVEGAPAMQSVVRAPIVRWNKYGISNELLEKEVEKGVVERDARFGSARVFGDPAGQRKASV
ncbi:hypothetical protein BZA70DRAFT_184403 [Myxozyma melibiosi]|uniref:Uncharacterized protein n=1 Tax=Myxozyma melibiosi TaxID=54550 RepID=A0ABR1F4L2_9ASCO